MKIVMDFRKYDGVIGGTEQGVIQITRYLSAHDHQVIMLAKENRFSEVRQLFKDDENITFKPLPVSTHAMSLRNAWMDSTTIQNIAANEGADIIHYPYNWSFPFSKRVPSVLTVHDVIPFTYREAMGVFRNLFLYKPGIRQACRLNNMIATVSEFSKQDIVKKVGVAAEKVRVIPNGLREPAEPDEGVDIELDKRFGLEDGFILNVGGIHERKNIVRLVRAFSLLVNREGYTGKLIITGSVSGAPYQIKMKKVSDAAVREAGMEERVVFTGFIPDKELDSLLRRADLMIYPSLYEGFGIPVLEAMKLGTPVITSNRTGMREVAGDAALLVDPLDIEDIFSSMSELLRNQALREGLKRKGLERAGHYSWENTAEQYLGLFAETRAAATGHASPS